jgi:toxin-antitoxin system PIN domain toxin
VTVLLDGNALVALCVVDHVHHDIAANWFSSRDDQFATTPITQGTLLRLTLREGLDIKASIDLLNGITGHPRHVFWPDDLPYTAGTLQGVVGHRQVTDAYLVTLARNRGGQLATFDRGLASWSPDVAVHVAP